jgi:hypothetical protein
MQILESSALGLRSAVHTFTNNDTGQTVRLIPMVHIGSSQFYSDVTNELAACDHILMEGIQKAKENPAKMRRRGALRALFLVAAWRLKLVHQNESLDLTAFKSKIINADVFAAEFNDKWAEISLRNRVWLWALHAVAIIYYGCTITRKRLAKNLAEDDLPSRFELIGESFRGMDEQRAVILDWRDDRLIEVLAQHLDKIGTQKALTSILYGAGHCRAIVKFLQDEAGFSVGKGKWLTVFRL